MYIWYQLIHLLLILLTPPLSKSSSLYRFVISLIIFLLFPLVTKLQFHHSQVVGTKATKTTNIVPRVHTCVCLSFCSFVEIHLQPLKHRIFCYSSIPLQFCVTGYDECVCDAMHETQTNTIQNGSLAVIRNQSRSHVRIYFFRIIVLLHGEHTHSTLDETRFFLFLSQSPASK